MKKEDEETGPKCGNCKWYRTSMDLSKGECFRRPPVPHLIMGDKMNFQIVSVFPPVKRTQFCGEFEDNVPMLHMVKQ